MSLALLGLAAVSLAQAQNTFVTGFAKNGNLHTNLNAKYPNDGIFTPGIFGGTSFDITADGQGKDFTGITNGAPATIAVGVFTVTNGPGSLANFLSGVTVATIPAAVPEASTTVSLGLLLMLGLGGMLIARKQRVNA